MTTKPTTSTKPDTTPAKPADTPAKAAAAPLKVVPPEAAGSPPPAPESAEGDVPESPDAAGKRPLTVMVSEATYKRIRLLAAAEGSSVTAVVVDAVETSIAVKLKAALQVFAKDLA